MRPRARASGGCGRSHQALATTALAYATLAVPARAADDVPTFADHDDAAEADETQRAFGLMIDPLAIAEGVFGGDLDIGVLPRVAVGIEGGVFQLANGSAAAALGVGLLVYPIRGTFHGLVLEPCAVYARPLREPLMKFDWRLDVVGLGGIAGWQWTWDYGLSVRLGAGPMRFMGGSRSPGIPVGRDGVDVVLDGSIGWMF